MLVATPSRVEPRRLRASRAACLVLGVLAACGGGDDAGPAAVPTGRDEDAGRFRFDATVPPLPDAGHRDAAMEPEGMPPDDLAGEPCAVDTNKIYELVRSNEVTDTTQLAVDLVESRFGVAYVSASVACLDALYVAEVEGPLSEPEIGIAVEECTTIEQPSVTYSEGNWLFAFVDNRMAGRDIWVQAYDASADEQASPYRITDSLLEKSEVQVVGLGPEGALIIWIEQEQPSLANDFVSRPALKVRPLWPDGEPFGPEATLTADLGAMGEYTTYGELRLSRIGESSVALGYREDYVRGAGTSCSSDTSCDTAAGEECEEGACIERRSSIVFEVLDVDGKRTRDPWALTDDAGIDGNADFATDEEGGAVIYTVQKGTEGQQLWFQKVDANGDAADRLIGVMVSGKEEPRRIVAPPVRALDASVTRLPTGFVVAYRALPLEMSTSLGPDGNPVPPPDNGVASPRIRVLFTDPGGRVLNESDVALSERVGGLTSIEAAYDGRVVLAWSDLHEDTSTSVNLARLPCIGQAP